MEDQAQNLRSLVIEASLTDPGNVTSPTKIWLASGKRGVGTTTIAVNLATTLARKGRRPLLANISETAADLELLCGLNAAVATANDALRPGPAGMLLMADMPVKAEDSLEGRAQRTLSRLQSYAHCIDMTLIDAGPSISGLASANWSPRDLLIYITTCDNAAVMDTYAAIKQFLGNHATQQPKIGLLVNRTRDVRQGELTYHRLASTCYRFLALSLVRMGEIPHQEGMGDMRRTALPAVLQSPTSTFARAVDHIAGLVAQHTKNPEHPQGS